MLQAMLADRFQFKSHFETRELPVYNLVTAKDGAKLKVLVSIFGRETPVEVGFDQVKKI